MCKILYSIYREFVSIAVLSNQGYFLNSTLQQRYFILFAVFAMEKNRCQNSGNSPYHYILGQVHCASVYKQKNLRVCEQIQFLMPGPANFPFISVTSPV